MESNATAKNNDGTCSKANRSMVYRKKKGSYHITLSDGTYSTLLQDNNPKTLQPIAVIYSTLLQDNPKVGYCFRTPALAFQA